MGQVRMIRTSGPPHRLAASILLIAGFASAAAAQAPDDKVARDAVTLLEGYASYKMGQYEAARSTWLRLAEAGNPTAMLNLANLYEQGQGVPADPGQAVAWMRRAAESGYAPAQLNYGLMFENGRLLPRDLSAAASWFEKAAAQGDRDAAFNLGILLLVKEQNPERRAASRAEARRWLSLAAEKGHPQASAFLAQAGE
jgi:TPR repeat protein